MGKARLKKSENMKDGKQNQESKADVGQEQIKDLKKLFDSHVAVLTHKLGRTPTMEEVNASIAGIGPEESQSQGQDQNLSQGEAVSGEEAGEDIPRILQYKVYYGMKKSQDQNGNESRQPDPTNILFYFDPTQNRYYDVSSRNWTADKPSVIDHLNERQLEDYDEGADIRDAIINGVLEDDDFEKLSRCDGMVDDRIKKLYGLMKTVKEAQMSISSMAKSEGEAEPEVLPESGLEENIKNPESGANVVESFMDVTGVPSASEEGEQLEVVPGDDINVQILAGAKGHGVEKRIRAWIREEFEKIKDEIREEMWAAINSSLQEEMNAGNVHSNSEVSGFSEVNNENEPEVLDLTGEFPDSGLGNEED